MSRSSIPVVADDAAAQDAATRLGFERTVDRRLVHKHAVEVVCVTDVEQAGEDLFWASAILPRANLPYVDLASPRFCRYDLGMLVELLRQAGLAVTHEFLGSPADDATVLEHFDLEVADPLVEGPMDAVVRAVVAIGITDRRERRGRLIGVSADITAWFGEGPPRIRSRMASATVPKSKYKAARAAHLDALPEGLSRAPVDLADPSLVGRTWHRNVLVSAPVADGPGRWRSMVGVDTGHPFWFEHPIGHVPGIIQLEAVRQAAVAAAVAAHPSLDPAEAFVRTLRSRYDGWAELDVDLAVACEVGVATPGPDGLCDVEMTCTMQQAGADLGTFELTLAAAERP